MRGAKSGAAGALCLLLAAACARYKTTDELRDAIRAADSSASDRWLYEPCEVPALDTFGWRLDSVAGIRFRVPSAVQSIPTPAFGERTFRQGRGILEMRLAPDAGLFYRSYVYQSSRWREEACSIADRAADVAVPLQKTTFATAIRWPEVPGIGGTLVAVVRARTLDEYRTLRAILFTISWP